MSRMLTIVLCISLALLNPAHAQTSSDNSPADLSKPFDIALGHVYALTLHQGIQTTGQLIKFDAPVSTSYDAKNQRIDIAIFGARNTIDGAKESMENFRNDVLGMALAGANHAHGVTVAESQVSTVYINRKSWEEVIRFADGRYAVP